MNSDGPDFTDLPTFAANDPWREGPFKAFFLTGEWIREILTMRVPTRVFDEQLQKTIPSYQGFVTVDGLTPESTVWAFQRHHSGPFMILATDESWQNVRFNMETLEGLPKVYHALVGFDVSGDAAVAVEQGFREMLGKARVNALELPAKKGKK